jgi:hypothetical protein
MIVTEVISATVVVETSVAGSKKVLDKSLDFVFLDVDVTNGKTFDVANILQRKGVPFVFVSGSPREQLPIDLLSVPFIPKPFCPAQITRALQVIVD